MLKILVRDGDNRDFFFGFFEAHLEDLEGFGLVLPLSPQQIYKDVDRGRDFGVDRWRYRGRGISFSRTDVLRARAFVFLALEGVVSRKLAMKAFYFMNAFGSFGGGTFRQGDGIDIHCIRVRGGLRGG